MIPVFYVVLISDKDENTINNGKHFVLFYFRSSRPEVLCKKGALRNFAKFREKYLCQIQRSNFIEVPASLVFAAISAFWFSGFFWRTIYKLITVVTAFLIAFLIKIDNKKLDQILTANISPAVLFCFVHAEHFWTSLEDTL